jgi:WD40 repeat protein
VAPARTRLSHEEGCGGLALTPDGRQVLWSAVRVHLTPVEGPPTADLVLEQGSRDDLMPCTAVDASGRWGATASLYTSRSLKKKIRIWDLVTGRTVREWAQAPEGEPDDGLRWLAGEVAFLADGRLIVGQAGGVRLLDPRTGASEWLWKVPPADAAVVVVSPDARRAAMVRQPQAVAGKFDLVGEIVVLDLGNGGRRSIGSHGSKFASLALDASGSVLVTGAPDGAVRVGPSDGREPHLLCCHAARVDAVAVSPDGKWIASGSGPEIRLWPMPDLSKPPLHTLPYDELMAKLRSLTNLEVVEDKAAATGYKIEIGPFPGWKDVPTW